MYIKLFKSSYKRDFSVTYSTDYNHRVKDGFFLLQRFETFGKKQR